MVKIIETNLSLNPNCDNDIILDHQSRVIEVESWEECINEFKNSISVERKAYLGNMADKTIPTDSKVENLKYDEFHLSCDVYNSTGMNTKKLAYMIFYFK